MNDFVLNYVEENSVNIENKSLHKGRNPTK